MDGATVLNGSPRGGNAPVPRGEEARRPTVLVVDDDESLQVIIRTILAEHYRVVEAPDAETAMARLADSDPDLLLLDLVLPGTSGMSVCRTIRREHPELRIPVIILTARTDLETKVEALEAGADDFLTKPFHPRELLTRIRVQLRIRELQRELVSTERLKAVVETAVSANHEINNPLCAVINNTELAMSLPAVKDSVEAMALLAQALENALRIEKTLQRMANIIQPAVSEYLPGVAMLDLTRSETKEEGR